MSFAIAGDMPVFSTRTREELVEHARHLFEQEGSAAKVGADRARLARFIDRCSQLYHANPYHNWHHAVDVTHTMARMLALPVLRARLPAVDAFWLMISAIAHDLDHPGHNNQWEINNHTPRANKYNNLAVLEHHSLDLAAELIAEPDLRFTESMSEADRARGETLMPELILATDFANHKNFLAAFTAVVRDHPQRLDFRHPEFALLVLKALMKAADIANTAKPFAEAKEWAMRVMQEFWHQGRLEKAHSFPVGPLNDEERVDLNQAQVEFIRFVALDLFTLLGQIEPGMNTMVTTLNENAAVYLAASTNTTPENPAFPAPRSAKS